LLPCSLTGSSRPLNRALRRLACPLGSRLAITNGSVSLPKFSTEGMGRRKHGISERRGAIVPAASGALSRTPPVLYPIIQQSTRKERIERKVEEF
jgi:hypothetical protein